MVSCTRCTARFSASPEIEVAWVEMHHRRFHDSTRAAGRPRFLARPSYDAKNRRTSSHRPDSMRTV
ncbi:MAG: hypothetical protein M0R74_05955 [Dehalococcoidia bacterium]|nr:hypothetical protein [Dehalococcoidia bacterium]